MQIVRYTKDRAPEWDAFVKMSKNGTFLFLRGYMDYHRDRFNDHSLMYYDDKQRLIAVMPANSENGVLYSHQGLTYGGFVLGKSSVTVTVKALFEETIAYLRANDIKEWHYKAIPTIYHKYPSEEDEYWLWRNGATLYRCNISCTVALNGKMEIPLERRRHRGIRKAEQAGYHIIDNGSLDTFWPIMLDNLKQRYNAQPVHTLEEMKLLQDRLPENIESFLCVDSEDKAQAGAVIYLANEMAVHVQYAHATPEGKDNGALDMLYAYLIKRYRSLGYSYFDIGTSNEDGGHYLNENLIQQKEGFGGRGIAYKQYKIIIS